MESGREAGRAQRRSNREYKVVREMLSDNGSTLCTTGTTGTAFRTQLIEFDIRGPVARYGPVLIPPN